MNERPRRSLPGIALVFAVLAMLLLVGCARTPDNEAICDHIVEVSAALGRQVCTELVEARREELSRYAFSRWAKCIMDAGDLAELDACNRAQR